MPITRRALLISNPGETGQENYCKGVYVDINNYKNWLLSPTGGAWESGEIQHLDRPAVSTVQAWISTFSVYDYLLVMFTGHGWYSSTDRDRILQLRKGEEMASLGLITGAKKRTVILDCCQKVHPESVLEKLSARNMILANASMGRTPNREACRQLYFDAIRVAPEGIVKITSCSIGEVSTDDDHRGGRYNGSLLECVESWAASQAWSLSSQQGSVYSIATAHEVAAETTRKLSGGLQNPTIEKPRTSPYFPIAVFG